MRKKHERILSVNWKPVFSGICQDLGEHLFLMRRRRRQTFKSNDTIGLRNKLFAELSGLGIDAPANEQEEQLAKMILAALEYGAANGLDLGARVYDMANGALKLRNGQTPIALRDAPRL